MKKIDYDVYFDKVFGCWLGKSIGGACGAISENNKKILNYTIENVFPEVIPPNDDLDLQVLWLLDVLEKKGTNITSKDFALSFAKHNLCQANEYCVAIKNIERGIYPPVSGSFENDYFKNSMGCPIRSEIWAVLAPGTPELAAHYAMMDGAVDHASESIYSEIFNAGMECEAFFEDDPMKLISEGLSHIPSDCRIRAAVDFAVDCYTSGLQWRTARNKFVNEFGSQDASYSVTNCGLTVLALLYGEKDYTKTLLLAVNGGYDTDCTAATALSVLGIITGAKNTPKFWLDKIGTELVVGTVDIECPYKTIESFAKASVRAGISFYQEGLWDTELVNKPDNVTGSLPKSQKSAVEISAKYPPSIGLGEKIQAYIKIKNNMDYAVCDILKITMTESLKSDFEEEKVTLAAGETVVKEFAIESSGIPLCCANRWYVKFVDKEADFGVAGAMNMTLIGPFWDDYDTSVYSSDPYGDVRQYLPDGSADLNAMFGGFVSRDNEYIDERFVGLDEIIDGKTDIPVKKVNIHGDIFDVDEAIGYTGPCCVYLVYDFYADERAEGTHHFGATAPFRVWENGKLIADSDKYFSWNPFNVNARMNINKGKNRMIFKLTRGDEFKFSWSMRNALDKEKYFWKTRNI